METLKIIAAATPEPSIRNFCGGQVVFYCQGISAKSSDNGDSLMICELPSKQQGILALADGVGGSPGGNRASGRALEILETALDKTLKKNRNGFSVSAAAVSASTTSSLREAILDGFENANQALLQLRSGAATTLFVAEIRYDRQGCTVRSYHAGDSAILIVGQKGKRHHQTLPHSPQGHALEAGIINEDESVDSQVRYMVTNCLGSNRMRIELGPPIALAKNDSILLASDGLTDNLKVSEIVEIVRKGNTLNAMEKLVSLTQERMKLKSGKPDDLSIMLFRTE